MNVAIPQRVYPLLGDRFVASAASETGLRIQEELKQIRVHLEQPATRRAKADAFEALSKAHEECMKDDWDGEAAQAISKEAYLGAAQFLEYLPAGFPVPAIVPEPSGAIGLEWHVRRNHVFVAAFAGDGNISYAGIFGKGNTTRGTEVFQDVIPPMIVRWLCRLYDGE